MSKRMTTSSAECVRLSWETFSQLKRIIAVIALKVFPDIFLLAFIPITIVVYMICGYYIILAPGNLYNALVSEDWKLFRDGIMSYALWATAIVVIKVTRGALRESSANYLRKRLTTAMHAGYFGAAEEELGYSPPSYYHIASGQRIDNPDQRLVSDARDFSASFLDILAGGSERGDNSGGLIEASLSVVFYSFKVFERTSWYGILVAYFWSIIVGLVSIHVINRTSPVVFRQEQLEADFRFGHGELRRNAEEIAFLRGAPFEGRKHTRFLYDVVTNTWSVIFRHVFLNLVQYGFSYYVSIIMYLAIALAVQTNIFSNSNTTFSSTMSPGEKAQWIAQTGGIFIQLLYSFTMVIELGTAISTFVTNSHRVATMFDELQSQGYHGEKEKLESSAGDKVPLMKHQGRPSPYQIDCKVSAGISVEKLTFHLGAKTKVGPVSFTVKKGEWVLIEGPSGSGKSTVLRGLRGLWIPSSGTIRIPHQPNTVMFVPQVAYIPSGICSLRELVRYPQECSCVTDETERVVQALESVGWRHGDPRRTLDVREEWSAMLSPGERQLLAAARVMERKPTYAVMDEPTSSLDLGSEKRVLCAIKAAGISGLTVGHRKSLPALHDKIIRLHDGHD